MRAWTSPCLAALLLGLAGAALNPAPAQAASTAQPQPGAPVAPPAEAPAYAPGSTASAVPAATACPPAPEPLTAARVTAGRQQAADHGLMWRAERNGRVTWLFGTLHAARFEWMFPGPTVQQALAASDRVVLELDPTDPATVQQVQQAMRSHAGTPPLPPDLATRLARQTDIACAGPLLKGMRPQAQAITLSLLAARPEGIYADYGIDGFLAAVARGSGLPVQALETPAQQMAVLFTDDVDERDRRVGDTLSQLEDGSGERNLVKLARAWADSDLDTLTQYEQWCGCVETDHDRAFMRRMVDDRNRAMAEALDRLHASGARPFVAIGSLHLTGPLGVPALLAGRGFVVRQVLPPLAEPAVSTPR